MVAYIADAQVDNLDDYFTMLGETGYQLYIVKEGGCQSFMAGLFVIQR